MINNEFKGSLKPMMKTSEMVSHLKHKNIKFEKMSEDDALRYLKYNNNYYNVTAYRHNFAKYPSPAGKYEGLYQDLDFAYLKDMAIIDYRVRLLLFKMVIDIEHYLKIRILNIIEEIDEEDGYKIVNSYLKYDYNNSKISKNVNDSIRRKVTNNNYKDVFIQYDFDGNRKIENIPVWEFLEIITFGELIRFYDFFIHEYNLKKEYQYVQILKDIVKLRNAVAHNTSILSQLAERDDIHPVTCNIMEYLKDCNIGKTTRKNKLNNSRIRQITCTLYMFNKVVTSDGIKENICKEINKLFFYRIVLHKDYYNNNELLKSVYLYFKNIIEKNYKNIKK